MSVCVIGIIGFQLSWNQQAYRNTIENFDHDINEAFKKATDSAMDERLQEIVNKAKNWLADSSVVSITYLLDRHDSGAFFYVRDGYRSHRKKRRRLTGGLLFYERDDWRIFYRYYYSYRRTRDNIFSIGKITPLPSSVKHLFIENFASRIILPDLKSGALYYTIFRLTDSIYKLYNDSYENLPAIDRLFKQELSAKGIQASFILDPADTAKLYLTQPVNINFRRPYRTTMIKAGFEAPEKYFLKAMRWKIIGSFLLLGIVFCCFIYTVRTLLSQHKLALLKDDFVNNMTHELNTPISSIKITAEALRNSKFSTETQSQYLNIISYQAEKLTDLTGQILSTSRIDHADKSTWADIDLYRLLQDAIDEIKPRLNEQHAVVNYSPPHQSLEVKGDKAGLLSSFTNIIDNALKYTRETARLDIHIAAQNGYAAIAFADNGIGIPPEFRGRIFEKFFRVPQGNLHNVKGYGLGLSYVSQVVRQHKGSIEVSPNMPYGSIITIKLPLSHG